MVKNSEIQTEFNIFSDGFALYKELLPAHSNTDDAYWQDVFQRFDDLCKKYNCTFCNEYVQFLQRDMERKAKEVGKNE